uniref:Alternative protein KIAA2013 n=1 Tax=Homo sapiens TaxID=9606 RepID=L8ECM5_HUMAN|nr:alternative protein KIAA2013 [Homo sapiens]
MHCMASATRTTISTWPCWRMPRASPTYTCPWSPVASLSRSMPARQAAWTSQWS